MPADTSKRDRVAILIGEQVDQNTANDFVVNATDGIPTVSSAGGATSVLVEPSAVSFGFSRVAQDPSNYGSTYYQKPGSFQHLDPSLSFTVPLRGGLFTTTPDLDISRALLLSGCGVGSGASNVVPDASDPSLFTQYNLAPTGVTYSTIKLWRGDECWVFVGCFMNITMNFTANEYGTLACEVFSGASTFYSAGNTVSTLPWAEYPTNIGYQEYTENPDHVEDIYPSLNLAAMSIGGIDRPLTSGSISVSNTTSSIPDSNAPEGVIISPEGRSVEFSGTFLENNSTNASNEFDYLITNGVDSASLPSISFGLGRAWDQAGAGISNSLFFGINAARITGVEKSDFSAERVANTVSGYAATTGSGTDVPFYIRGR